MAKVFDGKTFALLGRLATGTHVAVADTIIDAGGSVTKNWSQADIIVADSIMASHKARVDEFIKDGGTLVPSIWLNKSIDKGELEDDEVTLTAHTTPAFPSGPSQTQVGRSRGSKKRGHDADEQNDEEVKDSVVSCHTQPSPMKRSRKSSSTTLTRSSGSSASITPPTIVHEEIPYEELPDVVVSLDEHYSGIGSDEVLVDDQIWDATLNQTDIERNKNKFFVMQLTKSHNGSFHCFTRWGRVGVSGQKNLDTFSSACQAKDSFERKFKEKTKCLWKDKSRQQVRRSTYMYVQKEYSRRSSTAVQMSPTKGKRTHRSPPESQLDTKVQEFVKLIMNVEIMRKQIVAMGINVEELPLGKLTKSQIARGFAMLSQISSAISEKQSTRALTELSSAFYTLIPHKTYAVSRPLVIQTEEAVKIKLNLLQSLEDLRVGTTLLAEASEENNANDEPRHQLDIQYEKLNCKIVPLAPASQERLLIERFVKQTHNDIDDRDFGIKIHEIYSLSAAYESRFAKFSNCSNRQLLWHSSRLGNFAGIISQGLRIAPAEAPSSGYRMGKGIYFADSLHKSSMYCWASDLPSTQCLLLCEVALGRQQLRYADDMQASSLASGYHSTWAVGRRQNDPKDNVDLEPGLTVPCGREVWPELGQHTLFEHNEFVVYDEERVRPRYLLTTTFERL